VFDRAPLRMTGHTKPSPLNQRYRNTNPLYGKPVVSSSPARR
jgi:hypothetical protein